MNTNDLFGKKFIYDPTAVVCYCFGYTQADIDADLKKNGRSIILERIAAEKKGAACQCAVKNPTGRWCLPDVRRVADGLRATIPQWNSYHFSGKQGNQPPHLLGRLKENSRPIENRSRDTPSVSDVLHGGFVEKLRPQECE